LKIYVRKQQCLIREQCSREPALGHHVARECTPRYVFTKQYSPPSGSGTGRVCEVTMWVLDNFFEHNLQTSGGERLCKTMLRTHSFFLIAQFLKDRYFQPLFSRIFQNRMSTSSVYRARFWGVSTSFRTVHDGHYQCVYISTHWYSGGRWMVRSS
jgi:hypothetical protein